MVVAGTMDPSLEVGEVDGVDEVVDVGEAAEVATPLRPGAVMLAIST